MQSSRDSSVWRTLAAAFGDGLAFGVGVALTRNAAQLVATRPAIPELRPIAAAKLAESDAMLTVIDGRFAELESKARLDLEAFTAQARSQAESDMQSLREQMAAIHKEFAQTLARLIDDQIATTIAIRWQAVEERLRDTIREEVRLSSRDQQIAELRERVERQERNLLNLVMALGQSCLQAAEHISPEEPPPLPPPAADPELPTLI